MMASIPMVVRAPTHLRVSSPPTLDSVLAPTYNTSHQIGSLHALISSFGNFLRHLKQEYDIHQNFVRNNFILMSSFALLPLHLSKCDLEKCPTTLLSRSVMFPCRSRDPIIKLIIVSQIQINVIILCNVHTNNGPVLKYTEMVLWMNSSKSFFLIQTQFTLVREGLG